jgi:hypothetical protein
MLLEGKKHELNPLKYAFHWHLVDVMEDRTDLDVIFHNQEPTGHPNAGNQYHQGERQISEAPDYQQPLGTVSFDLASHHTAPQSQENFQQESMALGGQSGDVGMPPQHNAEMQALGYSDPTYDIVPLQSPVRNWNDASEGGGVSLSNARRTGDETNRSKELSSRMRYKYYWKNKNSSAEI